MMKWFNKREKPDSEKNDLTRKILDVLNYTPTGYEHIDKLLFNYDDAVEYMRRELKNIDIQQLIDGDTINFDILDPLIDSYVNKDKAQGEEKYLKNINTIWQLTRSAPEAAIKAEEKLKSLNEDRERLVSEQDALIKLKKSIRGY